jgi:hypothetical protein
VRARVDDFLAGSATRTEEVKQRCGTVPQPKAAAPAAVRAATAVLRRAGHALPVTADAASALV